MRGEKIYKILDFLEDSAMGVIDFVDVFLSTPYGSSLGKFEYEHGKRDKKRLDYKREREERRKLQKYVSKLKSDGLVSEDRKGQMCLTHKGQEKLTFLRKQRKINKNNYKKKSSNRTIIVSYDIPVKFNKERWHLIEILKLLGLEMVHQSVWAGNTKLPEQFLIDMKELGILKCIEVVEVTKSGTLKML